MAQQFVTPVPPEIRSVLHRLRRRIRTYVLLEGTALVLMLLALMFWVSLGLDWGYFQLRSLELPVWFRQGFAIATLGLFVGSFLAWVALRSLRSLRTRALALVLERRFPELDDRLITAVEAVDSSTGRETPLTAAMLSRTVDDVSRAARQLDVAAVFDRKPLRRALIGAAVLVASIAGFWVANASAMDRWAKAYLRWDETYWDRTTNLVVKVVAQPGDQIRHFKQNRYKHPRGGDLTLLVEVPEGRKPDGSHWQIPEQVRIHYRLDAGRGSGRATCMKLGDREFKYSVGGLMDGMKFWVEGADFINREPYEVIVVDPPRVDEVALACDYPPYTGPDLDGRKKLTVQGTQVSLPLETNFLMRAASNKDLVSVRIQFGRTEIAFGYSSPHAPREDAAAPSGGGDLHTAARTPSDAAEIPRTFQALLIHKSEDGRAEETIPIPPATAVRFLAADRRSFTVPFALSAAETDAARERASQPLADYGPPFILPPDSLIRIYLEDADEVTSTDPARLTINGAVDSPPIIETQLRGIGSSITRTAAVPVVGRILDDYGLAQARFEYQIGDDEEGSKPRPFTSPPETNVKEHKLQRSETEEFERFDVLPLDLPLGQKLTLTVFAQDGDDLNGPHSTRSEKYVFKIISKEELIAILHGKEVNLRRRFEQIIKEVEDTKKDLILHRVRAQEAAVLKAESPPAGKQAEHAQQIQQIQTAVAASAERALHQVAKNASETAAVEDSFRQILEELVNNAVHTRQMVERIDDLIVKPLRTIVEVDFRHVDDTVRDFKLANETGADPLPPIDASTEAIDAMLARMQQVLKEMQDLATFHEAVKELQTLIDDEEQLKDRTKEERKKKLIEGLK